MILESYLNENVDYQISLLNESGNENIIKRVIDKIVEKIRNIIRWIREKIKNLKNGFKNKKPAIKEKKDTDNNYVVQYDYMLVNLNKCRAALPKPDKAYIENKILKPLFADRCSGLDMVKLYNKVLNRQPLDLTDDQRDFFNNFKPISFSDIENIIGKIKTDANTYCDSKTLKKTEINIDEIKEIGKQTEKTFTELCSNDLKKFEKLFNDMSKECEANANKMFEEDGVIRCQILNAYMRVFQLVYDYSTNVFNVIKKIVYDKDTEEEE